MFGKRIAGWIRWIMRRQRNISLSMESPIYTFQELTRIVRVIGDHVILKARFSFKHVYFAEMTLFSISSLDLLSCMRDFLQMRSKYRRRTFAWNILGDIHGECGWIFMDFYLTGVCLSSKVLSVLWYCSHNCDKSSLGLVISSDFTMSSLSARMLMLWVYRLRYYT